MGLKPVQKRISIPEGGIFADIEKLKNIIIDEWQSGELYKSIYNRGHHGEDLYKLILSDLADSADVIEEEIEFEIQKKLNRPIIRLEWQDTYSKLDVRSIGFEVLNLLAGAWSKPIESLTTDDIPMILEFLGTAPDKSLEAWDKWEKYWANLDYAARRKKLLES